MSEMCELCKARKRQKRDTYCRPCRDLEIMVGDALAAKFSEMYARLLEGDHPREIEITTDRDEVESFIATLEGMR